jgi:hypothetical protein
MLPKVKLCLGKSGGGCSPRCTSVMYEGWKEVNDIVEASSQEPNPQAPRSAQPPLEHLQGIVERVHLPHRR